jgi:hypothetical protein
MPLLDWNSTSVITSHFWVYWAIAIPLTLITMLAVALWIFIQAKHNEAMAKAARDAVNKDSSSSDALSSLWHSSYSGREWIPSSLRNVRFRWNFWRSNTRRWDESSESGSGSERSLVDD